MLPQKYPFAFVDRTPTVDGDDRHLLVRLTSSGRMIDPEHGLSPIVALEILAQASIVLLGEPSADGDSQPAPGPGADKTPPAIGGFDTVDFDPLLAHEPLLAGDTVEARCQLVGNFGSLRKISTTLHRRGRQLIRAQMLLVGG